ncbi:MAG: hypothetical protein ACTSQS_15955 [Promethearchaeota archaeon]
MCHESVRIRMKVSFSFPETSGIDSRISPIISYKDAAKGILLSSFEA